MVLQPQVYQCLKVDYKAGCQRWTVNQTLSTCLVKKGCLSFLRSVC